MMERQRNVDEGLLEGKLEDKLKTLSFEQMFEQIGCAVGRVGNWGWTYEVAKNDECAKLLTWN